MVTPFYNHEVQSQSTQSYQSMASFISCLNPGRSVKNALSLQSLLRRCNLQLRKSPPNAVFDHFVAFLASVLVKLHTVFPTVYTRITRNINLDLSPHHVQDLSGKILYLVKSKSLQRVKPTPGTPFTRFIRKIHLDLTVKTKSLQRVKSTPCTRFIRKYI